MKSKLILYTRDNCPGCRAMKTGLDRLAVEYTEVKLTTGMSLPPDVRSFPTLAVESNGKRTTLCIGWPGSIEQLKKDLKSVLNRPETDELPKKGGRNA